jgi:UDP-3-O-[3-hydroxymyristoyl] N-acetylglucosamine deacetylase
MSRATLIQQTVARTSRFAGIGLHSGKKVTATVFAAPDNTGIRFETHTGKHILASWKNVVDTRLCTVLGDREDRSCRISTVEHILAAFSMCNIHNAIVSVDSGELPILDGSALNFCRDFISVKGNEPVTRIKVKRPVVATFGSSTACLLPSDAFSVAVDVDFGELLPRRSVHVDKDTCKQEIESARTFTFKSCIESMRQNGIALGGSLDNAIVFDHLGKPINPPLRFPDEWARHKTLDCIGDLSLAGAPIEGRFISYKPGHTSNFSLVKALMESPSKYDFITG